jgi:hypothetical protein
VTVTYTRTELAAFRVSAATCRPLEVSEFYVLVLDVDRHFLVGPLERLQESGPERDVVTAPTATKSHAESSGHLFITWRPPRPVRFSSNGFRVNRSSSTP